MRLGTFEVGGETVVGDVRGDAVVELDAPECARSSSAAGARGDRARLAARRGPPAGADHPEEVLPYRGQLPRARGRVEAVNWSHRIAPGIVFFQNVDAIIGPDDPIVYPEQLTKELDYELELAVVISRPGKFFGPRRRATTSAAS